MLILKHVEHSIENSDELENLLGHLKKITSMVEGIILKDVYFPKDKDEFVLALNCSSEESYLEWREACPPPPGAKDWYEVLFTEDEKFKE